MFVFIPIYLSKYRKFTNEFYLMGFIVTNKYNIVSFISDFGMSKNPLNRHNMQSQSDDDDNNGNISLGLCEHHIIYHRIVGFPYTDN